MGGTAHTIDWSSILKNYFWEDVLLLGKEYPDRRSLYLDFLIIQRINIDAADQILLYPDIELRNIKNALFEIDLPFEIQKFEPIIRFQNIPYKTKRRDLRETDINHIVVLDGLILRLTEVSPKILTAAFRCKRCDDITYMHQTEGVFMEPFECENEVCGRKGPFKLLLEKSTKVNTQKLRLQELPEELKGGEKSQTIDISLDEDLVGVLLPGQRVTVMGILRAIQRQAHGMKSCYLELHVDAISVRPKDIEEDMIVLPDDIERFKKDASSPDIIDKLVSSFATSVYGLEDIKLGLLCSAVSNGYHFRPDGTPQREYSHMLVCGDPGTAKTNLKFAYKAIKPDTVLSSGTGASKAGLTAAAIKDDFAGGVWSIEAGILPLADHASAIIDEFDKLNKDDMPKLNDALSNCSFEKDAAGLHVKLWARCNVIAIANPKHGRFDKYNSMVDEIPIPPDTLSRFDLVFLLPDTPEPCKDDVTSDYIINAWTAQTNDNATKPYFSLVDVQKYISYARSIKIEGYDKIGNQVAKEEFLRLRKISGDKMAIRYRHLEAFFRLAKAFAQLCLKTVVAKEHFEMAIRLLGQSLSTVCKDESGAIDVDIIETGMGKAQRDKIKNLRDLIKSISKDNGKAAPLGEIVLACEGGGLKQDEVESLLSKLKSNGDIIEVSNNRYMVVD